MTTLSVSDFPGFFTAVNGVEPFPWQYKLLEHVVHQGCWPEAISAPTGSGKSNVLDVHVFANALSALGAGPRVPRRMSLVVDRRAIVDSQALHAERLRQQLANSDDEIVAAVADALRLFNVSEPLVLAQLRGGISLERGWIDSPAACAIINATPDMWGSRLLLRGYGSRRQARPREAGLLAYDNVMVLDEAHLNRQLVFTARRIAELEQRTVDLGVPGLQVVESTATPRDDVRTVGVGEADLDHPVLGPRLNRVKQLNVYRTELWTGKKATAKYIDFIAQCVRQRHADGVPGTIGCVVNRVDTAVGVAQALRDLEPLTWVGPMRPMDLRAMVERYPKLFSGQRGDDDPRVIVATQTAEVGIDLDLGALVTELAPASALAQRAGRVNRRGMQESAHIDVIAPVAKPSEQLPYSSDDLQAALEWLATLGGRGMTLTNLLENPAPPAGQKRMILMRPEVADSMRWAATSEPGFAEESLELWLRDSLEQDMATGGLVIRERIPTDSASGLALLRVTPPVPDETWPVPIYRLHEILDRVLAADTSARAFRWRDGDGALLTPGMDVDLAPGDVLVVDKGHSITRQQVADPNGVPEQMDTSRWGDAGRQVLVASELDPEHPHEVPEPMAEDSKLEEVGELGGRILDQSGEDDLSYAECVQRAWHELGGVHQQVIIPPDSSPGEKLAWLVIEPERLAMDEESIRQEWSASRCAVPLDVHQQAVGALAREFATTVGLDPALIDQIERAGLWHDEGKADPRFQKERLAASDDILLAKSGRRSAQDSVRAQARSSLPRGWRHELRSAAVARTLGATDLEIRLIGTTHGYGRGGVSGATADLTRDKDDPSLRDAAAALFDRGEWFDLVERTDSRWGVWGCAYLEALLRAADCTTSREGS